MDFKDNAIELYAILKSSEQIKLKYQNISYIEAFETLRTDLAKAMEVDVSKLERDVKTINPNAAVVATNGRTGEGVKRVAEALGL